MLRMPHDSYPRCCNDYDVHAAALLLLLLQTVALGGAVTGEFLR
jgi:hypothetical protein